MCCSGGCDGEETAFKETPVSRIGRDGGPFRPSFEDGHEQPMKRRPRSCCGREVEPVIGKVGECGGQRFVGVDPAHRGCPWSGHRGW